MTLVLRWNAAQRSLVTRWRGPKGMAEAIERQSERPIAAIIGPPGPAGGGGGTILAPVVDGSFPPALIQNPDGSLVLAEIA